MYALSPEGEEVTLTIFKAGAYFPLMIPLSERQNTYYFQTQEEVTAFKAPLSDVLLFLHEQPDVLFNLAVSFSKAMMGLTTRIETILFSDAYQKIVRLLVYFAEKENTGEDTVAITTSQEQIASWLGLQRETVSRNLQTLKKAGLLTTQNNRVTILKLSDLQKEIAK